MTYSRILIFAIVLCRLAGCGVRPVHAQYALPRPRPIARALQPCHVARVFTNAPANARIGIPLHNVRKWRPGLDVQPGDAVTFLGDTFICVQAHRSQSDWMPTVMPALWRLYRKAGEGAIPEWRQPLGAHDAYRLGDKVMFAGKVWRNTTDNNVWMPGIYGWEAVP